MQRARLNGIEMAYTIRGTGEPLLLLHGFGGCGRDWDPVVSRLAEHYRVINVDLRGHGGSTNPSGVFTHRQSGADVLALVDHLGLARVRAMGISSGGMTLLHAATQKPERIEAMILIGATSYFPEQARAIMRAQATDRPGPNARGQNCATRGGGQIRQLEDQFVGFKDSYDDMNFTAPYLGTIKARTLIVHGDRDEFFPVEIPVEMYRAIPGSQLWIVPGGGHVPIYGPRLTHFVDVALRFLRGSPTGSGADAFLAALRAHCGKAYVGRVINPQPSDSAFTRQRLVMHVRACGDTVRIPFHVGDDRSRTWVFTRTSSGVRLKHDHRHADGSEDAITQYGGDSRAGGTVSRMEFAADSATAALIPAARTNVWTVEVTATRFVYQLVREGTERRFRVEFDIAVPVAAPPAPWGSR